MIRKLVVAMAAAGAISAETAMALGLGEITLHSSLNQPLDAEIKLHQIKNFKSNEILPNLATKDDFERAGVERPFFLSDLRFKTVVGENGLGYVKVTSSKPIKEPFVNFLMEVHWPNGRMLREYTLLLDPPVFADKTTPQPILSMSQPAQVSLSQSKSKPAPKPSAVKPIIPLVTPASPDKKNYQVAPNDSLWVIASKMRPSSAASIQQTMLAIQRLNPDAFIDDNINLIKRGKVLRLPTMEEIKSLSQAEAVAQVSQQNERWKRPVVDARKRTEVVAKPPSDGSDGRLQIVGAKNDQGATDGVVDAGGSKQEIESLQNELAINQERMDKLGRENNELKSRLTDLEKQINTLDRLITLKDSRLAKLQAQLQKAQKLEKQEDIAVVPPSSKTDEVDWNYEDPKTEQPDIPPPIPNPPSDPIKSVTPPDQKQVKDKPVEGKVETPKSEAEPPGKESGSGLASVLDMVSSPVVLGGAGAALLVLLGGMVALARRKSNKEEELLSIAEEDFTHDIGESDQAMVVEEAHEDAEPPAPESSHESPALSELDDLEKQLQLDGDTDLGSDTAVGEVNQSSKSSADIIGEADIYISYERYQQAADLLQEGLKKEPDRQDVRLKLMEVLIAQEDQAAFTEQFNQVQASGDKSAISQAETLKAQLGSTELQQEPEQESDDVDSVSLEESLAELESELGEEIDLDSDLDAELDEIGLDDLTFGLDDLTDEVEDKGQKDTKADQDEKVETAAEPDSTETEESLLDGLELDVDLDGLDDLAEITEDASNESSSLDDEFDLSLPDTESLAESLPEHDTSALDELDKALELDADLDMDLALDDLPEDDSTDTPSLELAESDTVLDEEPIAAEPELESVESLPDDGEDFLAVEAELASDDDLDLSDIASDSDDGSLDDEFDFLAGTDESSTKLDLARAYIDMGDADGARDILSEVIAEGSDTQKEEAQGLLEQIE